MYYIDGAESTAEQFAAAIDTNNYTYVDIDSIAYDGQKVIMNRIREYKSRLKETDYQATKNAEGELDNETYMPIRQQRAAWRAAINELEAILAGTQPVVKTYPLFEAESPANSDTTTTENETTQN